MSGAGKKHTLAREAYDAMAEGFTEHAQTSPYNAFYDRPAMLSLLPALEGKRVLDAGCGPGIYLEQCLALNAAELVGVDFSENMLRCARQRLGDGAILLELDLNDGLPGIESDYFDVVISALALDYVYDWDMLFREFHRVLSSGGVVVFSVEHPHLDRNWANYFKVELMTETWPSFSTRVERYRRSLQDMLNPLLKAGFCLDQVLEPKPLPEFAITKKEDYQRLCNNPYFICFRASKVPQVTSGPG